MNAKLLVAVVLAVSAPAFAQTAAVKPTMAPACSTCHKAAEGTLRGYLDGVAVKSSAMQLNLGAGTEIVRFDPKALKVLDAGASKNP